MLESIKLDSFRTEKRAGRKNTQSMKFTLKLDDIDAEVIQRSKNFLSNQ